MYKCCILHHKQAVKKQTLIDSMQKERNRERERERRHKSW